MPAKSADHPDLHIGRRRAVPPALGNDPQAQCNPLGATRLVTFSPAPMEFIQTPDRVLQNFEWTWDHREIWMDGRKLPNVDDYLPRYNGYSVAKWDGNTFVVTTVGFDDRAWVDHYGYPMSDKMQFEERYQRVSYSRLKLDMTITDPVIFTAPLAQRHQKLRLGSEGKSDCRRLVGHLGGSLPAHRRERL